MPILARHFAGDALLGSNSRHIYKQTRLCIYISCVDHVELIQGRAIDVCRIYLQHVFSSFKSVQGHIVITGEEVDS